MAPHILYLWQTGLRLKKSLDILPSVTNRFCAQGNHPLSPLVKSEFPEKITLFHLCNYPSATVIFPNFEKTPHSWLTQFTSTVTHTIQTESEIGAFVFSEFGFRPFLEIMRRHLYQFCGGSSRMQVKA